MDSSIHGPNWTPSLLPSSSGSCTFLNFVTFVTMNPLFTHPFNELLSRGSLKLVKLSSAPVFLILLSNSLQMQRSLTLLFLWTLKWCLWIRELPIMSFSLMIPQLIRQSVHLVVSVGFCHSVDWSLVHVKLGAGLFQVGIPCMQWSQKLHSRGEWRWFTLTRYYENQLAHGPIPS